MGIPDIRQLVTLDFEVYGHVQGADNGPLILDPGSTRSIQGSRGKDLKIKPQ